MPTREGQPKGGPSAEQRTSGNYPKRKFKFAGMSVRIENERQTARPPGGDREHPWAQRTMPFAYGYLEGTRGADGDEIDCFIGGDEKAEQVYVIHQNKPSGAFDEHKVMLGFHSLEEAEAAYQAAYQNGWDRVRRVEQMTPDEFQRWAYKAKPHAVHTSFPARAQKEIRYNEQQQPILRVIASGTKLDATSGIDEEGREVIGEKVAPMLLQKMLEQAKGKNLSPQQAAAGGIYFIESHETTLPLGWVVDAGIQDLDDGHQQLWADIRLDMDNPMVPFLVKKFETAEYEPDCSVGLKVLKGVIWDEEEGGYVGYMVDGYWEHIALTKPGHPAYPDATLEDVFLEEEADLVSATKAVLDNIRGDVIAANKNSAGGNVIGRKGEEDMEPVKVRATEKDAAGKKKLEAKNKETTTVQKGDLTITHEGESESAAPPPPAAKPAAPAPPAKPAPAPPKEADAEGEASAEAGSAPPPPPPKGRGVSAADLRNHLMAIHKMVKEGVAGGASPEEFRDLMADIMEDVAEAAEIAEEMMGGEPEAMDAESEADAEAKKTKEAEARKAKEAEAEAKKESESEGEAKKESESEADAKKESDAEAKKAVAKESDSEGEARKNKESEELVTKSHTERRLKRMIRQQAEKIDGLETVLKSINDKLTNLESKPATRQGPVRFNDPAALRSRIEASQGPKGEELQTVLKSIQDPKARDLTSRIVAQELVENALRTVFPGLEDQAAILSDQRK